MSKQRKYDLSEARERIMAWCAIQERAQQEVRDKLHGWGIHSNQVESLIAELISDNFLNEERFARAFTSGKFRIKQWGRVKIIAALQQKRISPNCIALGLREIEPEEYAATLERLIEKKARLLGPLPLHEQRRKLAAYLAQKGYESELAWEAINAHLKPSDYNQN